MTFRQNIAFLLFLISFSLQAQTDFKQGFIVKNNDDTLFGKIDYRGDLFMGQLCRFKTNSDTVADFYPTDLKAYKFIDSKYFISKQINGRAVFLEYLFNGIVNLYYLRNDSGDHYYIERDTIPLTELNYKEEIISKNGVRYLFEAKGFIGQLNYFMKDAQGIEKKIERIDKPDHAMLIKLAYDYHTQVCKDKKCIIYEKQFPLFQISIEPSAEIIWYKGITQIQSEYGAYLYFWAPRTNEKLYVKTGVFAGNLLGPKYFYTELSGDKQSVIRIPLQIQYMADSRLVNPAFSFGFNILRFKTGNTKDYWVTTCLNAGIAFKISKSCRLGINVNTQYTSILAMFAGEFSMISTSCDIGLIIKI